MINFEIESFDLGDVKFRQVVTKTIRITNTTNNPLHIKTPQASCSCTTGYTEENPLPPNSSTNLKINFDSSKTGLGSQNKSMN